MQEEDKETAKIPDYLDYTKPHRTFRDKSRHLSNLVFFIFNQHMKMAF
jgi:hypothetical protein